jgi:hypothetical protein
MLVMLYYVSRSASNAEVFNFWKVSVSDEVVTETRPSLTSCLK